MTLHIMLLCETFVIFDITYVVYIQHSETFAEINYTSSYVHIYVCQKASIPTCREIYVGHSSKEYTYMIIGVVHKDRELTFQGCGVSIVYVPDRKMRNYLEMNDIFSLHPNASQY